MKVGDLVKGTILPDQNIGLVVGGDGNLRRVHFMNLEEDRANPSWISVEYLEVINESR